MSFADPQSITIGTDPALSLPRVASGVNQGSFQSNDGLVKASASHQYGRRIRRQFRVDKTKIAPSASNPAINATYSCSVYMVVDTPLSGFTNTELQQLVTAFQAMLTANSNANTTKLLGGES